MTTESETAPKKAHPLCQLLRELRLSAGLSLAAIEKRHGVPAVVIGAYERGDRVPPLSKLDQLFAIYGYVLRAIPIGSDYIRLPGDVVTDLRAIASQLEDREQQATGSRARVG